MKGAEHLHIRDVEDGAVLTVKVVPGSSRDRVIGVLGDALKIAVSAAPQKGKANAAVARTLAKALGVHASAVALAGGSSSPVKRFRIAGLSAQDIRNRL